MIGHQYESMQFVKSAISATNNPFDDNICQGGVDKDWMFLPGIGRHEIRARLVNSSRDPSQIRTLRG